MAMLVKAPRGVNLIGEDYGKNLSLDRPLRYNMSIVNTVSYRSNVITRVIRNGEPLTQESHWDSATPEQRIEAVWELTLLCLAWQGKPADEPRLQRSVSRIQRPQR